MSKDPTITVKVSINAPVAKVWKVYTMPEHIIKWNNASDDWYTPFSKNDLRVGGKFISRMESIDGKQGFDFEGTYTRVDLYKLIEYTMPNGRKVSVQFEMIDGKTDVKIVFDAEQENSLEKQAEGWQAILNNFKKYTETLE